MNRTCLAVSLLPAIHGVRINKMKYFSKLCGDVHCEFNYSIGNEINRWKFYLQIILWILEMKIEGSLSNGTCQLTFGADFDRITPRNIRRTRSLAFQIGKFWLPAMLPHLKRSNFSKSPLFSKKKCIHLDMTTGSPFFEAEFTICSASHFDWP